MRVLLDAEGSKSAGATVVQQMRDAGCRVVFFHERRLRNVGVFNDRDHRKLVVIGGREAFAGGHCVVDEWLGDAEDGKHLTLWSDGDDQFEDAVLQEDGSVLVLGMDKSPRVSRVFGEDITSYEWVYVVAPPCVPLLVHALDGTPADDVLALLATYYRQNNGRIYDPLCGPSVAAQFDSWQS